MYNGSNWVNSGLTLTTTVSSLTDTVISSPTNKELLTYNGTEWVNSGLTYDGGFRGSVTKTDSVPTELQDNQWVYPVSQPDGTYEYTFDNFLNNSGLGIYVNLSSENIFLRYDKDGDYWVKESFIKPLGNDKMWVGNANNEVSEIDVIDEWSSVSGLTDIGQKYDLQTQTLMKVSVVKTSYIQNYVFIQNINLSSTGSYKLISSISGKKLLIKNIKIIILNNAGSDSFTISVGNNATSYDNVVSSITISNILTDEYYNLTLIDSPVGSDGTIISINSTSNELYLKVVTAASTSPLECHALLEGFIF